MDYAGHTVLMRSSIIFFVFMNISIVSAQIALYNNTSDINDPLISPHTIECGIGVSPLTEIFPAFSKQSSLSGIHYLLAYGLSDNFSISIKSWHNIEDAQLGLLYGFQVGTSILLSQKNDALSFSLSPQVYITGNEYGVENSGVKLSSTFEKKTSSILSPRITLSSTIGLGGCDSCTSTVLRLSENNSKSWFGVVTTVGCNVKLSSIIGMLIETGISIRHNNYEDKSNSSFVVGLTTYCKL